MAADQEENAEESDTDELEGEELKLDRF
jgi:hypothetical protein